LLAGELRSVLGSAAGDEVEVEVVIMDTEEAVDTEDRDDRVVAEEEFTVATTTLLTVVMGGMLATGNFLSQIS